MGAFDVVPNITIPDPTGGKASEEYCLKHGEDATAEQEFRTKWGWEAHEQAIMKGAYTGAEQEAVDNASSKITLDRKKQQGNVEQAVGTARNKLLEMMVVDWTFAESGRKVQVTPANIRRLPANYRIPLLEHCDELASGMAEDEQKDFLPSANGHSQEVSEAMSQSLTPS